MTILASEPMTEDTPPAACPTEETLKSAIVKEPPLKFVPLNDGSVPKIDLALNQKRSSELNLQIESTANKFQTAFDILDTEKSYESLLELLWNTGLPCVDVLGTSSGFKDELSFIKRCFWKNEPISCNAIFDKRPTDQGMCCSFNHEKAENLFKPTKYSNMMKKMQKHEKRMGATTPHLPDWYRSNQEPISDVGRDYGLTLVIDAHSNRLSTSSVSENFRGFVTYVDENSKYPAVSSSGLIAKPGHASNVEIDATKLDISVDAKKMDPTKRNCYFSDEYGLEFYQKYSQSNCLLECELQLASKCMEECSKESKQDIECKCEDINISDEMMKNRTDSCIPWFYPTIDENVAKICDPWETQQFQKIIRRHIPKNKCNHCLPDCSITSYGATMAYAPLSKCDHTNFGASTFCDLTNSDLSPAPWMALADNEFKNVNKNSPLQDNVLFASSDSDRLRHLNTRLRIDSEMTPDSLPFPAEFQKNPTYDAFKEDIGLVNIFFRKRYVNSYVTKKKVSLVDFLSKLGGSLGFLMGISIVSVIEIFYWIAFRLIKNLKRNKIQ